MTNPFYASSPDDGGDILASVPFASVPPQGLSGLVPLSAGELTSPMGRGLAALSSYAPAFTSLAVGQDINGSALGVLSPEPPIEGVLGPGPDASPLPLGGVLGTGGSGAAPFPIASPISMGSMISRPTPVGGAPSAPPWYETVAGPTHPGLQLSDGSAAAIPNPITLQSRPDPGTGDDNLGASTGTDADADQTAGRDFSKQDFSANAGRDGAELIRAGWKGDLAQRYFDAPANSDKLRNLRQNLRSVFGQNLSDADISRLIPKLADAMSLGDASTMTAIGAPNQQGVQHLTSAQDNTIEQAIRKIPPDPLVNRAVGAFEQAKKNGRIQIGK